MTRRIKKQALRTANPHPSVGQWAYGDWTSTQLSKWKPVLLAHSVQPIQQFAYTTGKNSTDSALIIDAMDLLHGGTVDGFGQRNTPQPFVAACTQFVYVENLAGTEAAPKQAATPAFKKDPALDKLLSEAVDTAAGDDGWAQLGAVGSNLSRLASDFDTRTWGYAKLKDLMVAHPSYEVTSRKASEGKQPSAYVRRAQGKKAQ